MIKKSTWSMKKTNLLLLLLALLITTAPFFFHPPGAEFSGADNQGADLVQSDHPEYKAWFEPLWEPPSSEIESLFFALQAGTGAGIVGYILGYLRGRKQKLEGNKGKGESQEGAVL